MQVPPIFTAQAVPQNSFVPPPQAPNSFAPPPQAPFILPPQNSYVPPPLAGDGDPDMYAPGVEVIIGNHRFRATGVLGRGSFSEVWSGEEIGSQEPVEVALKDISCGQQSDLQQALFEADMLLSFSALAACSYRQGSQPPQLRIPRYLSHRVDSKKGSEGWRVRMAMTRVPGESLDAFLKRPPPPGQDVQSSVRRGCMLAMQMIRQLAPSLETISQRAVHRDVNAHNVLISDAVEGGPFRCSAEPEEAASRANFWLIDFGLAVDSTTWHTAWRDADIGGDCRYWPQSSWFVSFWGADEISAQRDLCNQYKNRLDIFGLGITALELLCTTALDGSNAAGCQMSGSADGLRGSWRRLLNAWTKYWTDVTRWHTMIYRVFSLGGDVGPLYQELAKERVVDKILSRMAQIRQCLRQCVNRTEDPRIQSLLNVVAEMLDESSALGFREAVQALGGEVPPHPLTVGGAASPHLNFLHRPMLNVPAPAAAQTPAQAAVQAMRQEGAAAQAAAQGMVAQVAASARGRAEQLQAVAREAVRGAVHVGSAASSGNLPSKDAQAVKLQWCAPSFNNNSFVPSRPDQMPQMPQSNSFVPPPMTAPAPMTGPAPMSANNSYVPLPAAAPGGAPGNGGGSYVPHPMTANGSNHSSRTQEQVLYPNQATAFDLNMRTQQQPLKHGPSRTARPQFAGA
jgi:serine/threonine protein kinase